MFLLKSFVIFSFVGLYAAPLSEFVSEGLKNNQLLKEKQFESTISKHNLDQAYNEAILPKLRVSLAFGPAPGIIGKTDTIKVPGQPDRYDDYDEYDFSKLGSYFGVVAEVNQPLNFGRLNLANKALKAKHQVTLADIEKAEIKFNTDLQELYFGYQLALATNQLASKVQKEFNKIADDLEEKLDDGDESVSQLDLLELKSNLYSLEEGLFETEEGLKRAKANINFLFQGKELSEVIGADSILMPHPAQVPSMARLESLLVVNQPDLTQLKYGLIGLKNNYLLEASDMGPEFFLFGKFEFTKSWARDRLSQERNVFSQDPLNTFSGALGIGARFDLNFWNIHHKAVSARFKYKSLEYKGEYAEEGLLLKMREAYFKVIRHQERMKSASKSLRASDAWVKGTALKYDLDKSQQGALLNAYKKNISLQKDYYFAIYDYNLAVARLIESCGLSLNEFLNL